jgi:hypothetical protein
LKKINSQGFSLVEGLLVVIALCLVIGVGTYVYNSHNKDQGAATSAQNNAHKSAEANQTDKKYLKIPELGIKFELTDKLKNAYYAKVDNYYYLSVRELDDSCPAGGSMGGLGILGIVTGKAGEVNDTVIDKTLWTESELQQTGFKKVGDRYYGFMHGNVPCSGPDTPNADQILKSADEYNKAFIAQIHTIQKL